MCAQALSPEEPLRYEKRPDVRVVFSSKADVRRIGRSNPVQISKPRRGFQTTMGKGREVKLFDCLRAVQDNEHRVIKRKKV